MSQNNHSEEDGTKSLESGQHWLDRWKEGDTPWDFGRTHPWVEHLAPQLPSGRVLVPGCGTGYDVMTFVQASPARVGVGLDLSPLACKRAEALRDELGVAVERAQFRVADFFEYDDGSPFDLVYDHTFFCAIPPSWRPNWALKMASLVATGGFLFTLMFPVKGSGTGAEGGPPFSVSHEAYASVLEPVGFTLREGGEIPPPYQRTYPERFGNVGELYGIWVRNQHPA